MNSAYNLQLTTNIHIVENLRQNSFLGLKIRNDRELFQ